MPKLFGWEHITYILVCLTVICVTLVLAKKYFKTEKSKTIFIKIVGAVLLAAIVSNRISIVFKTEIPAWSYLLPDSICGVSSFVLALATLFGKKDNHVLQFIWFISLLGGTAVTFYSNFIGQNESFLYLPTITGFLHHTLAAATVITLFLFGWIRLDYRRWYCPVFGMTSFFAIGAFFISVMGYEDALNMKTPILPNTPLTTWAVLPLYFLVISIIYLVVELVRRKKAKKVLTETTEEK